MTKISKEQKATADKAAKDGDVALLAGFFNENAGSPQLLEWYHHAGYQPDGNADDNARLIIAHTHSFDTWASYSQFQNQLQHDPALQQFEQAADAIATGDAPTLESLLHQNPALIHMRSVRKHHSTLLNYIGANGIEGYRQTTPKNAVEIATILLNAGAEVDAWGDMYGGTSTLGLVATSVHPVITRVQQELMDIIIRHGADPNHAVAPNYTNGLLILACLHNGRYEPLHYLAGKGAMVDLEGAGGMGDLEKVKSYFNASGELIDPTLQTSREGCMIWACLLGHQPIVEYLLSTGLDVNTKWDGTTPLHSAAFGGQLAIVRLLLQKGAAMETLNSYDGTVLGATLWAWYNDRKPAHREIMETLINTGAVIKDDWQGYVDEIRGGG
ncbi:MAG: ankyrin repeat domain-containing protein [Mucilaginibacter sp.]